MEILDDITVDLSPGQVLPRLRVSPESSDADAVRALLDRVSPLIRPKAIYDLCYVGGKTATTVEIGGVVFRSRVLRVNLDGTHRVFPYIATCGTELEDVPSLPDDPVHRYWLEEIKAMALSAASAHLRQHIEDKYKPGRMSQMAPGSLQDWPITQQTQLFSLFGDVEARIGVRLTDSFLMLPLKSVSGILFPTEISFESCRLCPRAVCPGRCAPYDENLWAERYAEK